MKKKIIFMATAAAAIAVLFAAGCNTNPGTTGPNGGEQTTEYTKITRAYDGADEAASLEKKITVSSGETVLSWETETYTKAETGYTLVVNSGVLNEIGEGDGMYAEDEETTNVSGIKLGAFPKESDFILPVYGDAEDTLTLTAKLSATYLTSIGFAAGNAEGDVDFEAVVTAGKFVSLDLAYTSSNGNSVTISFDFAY